LSSLHGFTDHHFEKRSAPSLLARSPPDQGAAHVDTSSPTSPTPHATCTPRSCRSLLLARLAARRPITVARRLPLRRAGFSRRLNFFGTRTAVSIESAGHMPLHLGMPPALPPSRTTIQFLQHRQPCTRPSRQATPHAAHSSSTTVLRARQPCHAEVSCAVCDAAVSRRPQDMPRKCCVQSAQKPSRFGGLTAAWEPYTIRTLPRDYQLSLCPRRTIIQFI